MRLLIELLCFLVIVLPTCFCIAITEAAAKDYTFTWQPNPEPIKGYKLYYKQGGEGILPVAPFNGTDAAGGNSPSPIDVGKQESFTITGLKESLIYYVTLTAYNDNGESDYTQVVMVGPKPTILSIESK